MKQFFVGLLIFGFIFSCAEENTKLTFTEVNTLKNDNTVIEINIPKANGNSQIAENINSKIENHIANMLVFLEEDSDTLSLDFAIKSFDTEYASFKEGFTDSALVWDASFDGEVTYQSSSLTSIPITSYINSGGAHGNTNITFFNFDTNGSVIENNDLFLDKDAFIKVAKTYFIEEVKDTNVDQHYIDNFELPANIGFNDEGVILFYNVYEIASYADGFTEFTIPFEEVENFLKIE